MELSDEIVSLIKNNSVEVIGFRNFKTGKYLYSIEKGYETLLKTTPFYNSAGIATKAGEEFVERIKKLDLTR
jgi:hypothetical protein